ncbi:MAG: hypothetical protein DA408_15185 [Bacteroidetes bacterium]|nr:MAG: hypothetical protein C7N36_15050 [Bacteroidota bacterium]PTM10807.1 MAG: hypothetical protein DA408_15185 [Bacteroidota bacterium]
MKINRCLAITFLILTISNLNGQVAKDSKLVILADAPHFSMWSASEDYFKAIDEFITGLKN